MAKQKTRRAASGQQAAPPLEQTEQQRLSAVAAEISTGYQGVELSCHHLQSRRSVQDMSLLQVAESFETTTDDVTLMKRLFSSDEATVRNVRVALGKLRAIFRDPYHTLPWPREGVRLLKEGAVQLFESRMVTAREELQAATFELINEYPAIVGRQQERLGRLFDPQDYRREITIRAEWSYVTLTPPAYLMSVDKALYEREEANYQRLFATALQQREQELAESLYSVVDHLVSRLEGGEQRVFRNSAVENIQNALTQAEHDMTRNQLGSQKLRDVIKQLREVIDPDQNPQEIADQLRASVQLRETACNRLSGIGETIFSLSELAPRRSLLRDQSLKKRET